MALVLGPEEQEYLEESIQNAISLLDNVHCYDTDEIRQLRICSSLMRGFSLEDALQEEGSDE